MTKKQNELYAQGMLQTIRIARELRHGDINTGKRAFTDQQINALCIIAGNIASLYGNSTMFKEYAKEQGLGE